MKTVRRMLYGAIAKAVAFVALAFLSLFFFFDFVSEIARADDKGYTVLHAALRCLLLQPGHLYELAPIAVLIGSIYALASLAHSSEFTILRTGGLGPGRALATLTGLGAAFALMTFVVGDYLAPLSEARVAEFKASFRGGLKLDRAGAWLKDRRQTDAGERSYSINIGSATGGGALRGVRIFEFDADGRLLRRIAADAGQVEQQGLWRLADARVTDWDAPAGGLAQVHESRHDSLDWRSALGADVVAAALLPLATMSTLDLLRYTRHLAENEQASQRYEIQFWKRALYPFACLVMIALALPFAYMHARGGGISLKVFGGIMLGVSFVLLNNLASHVGLLGNWTPWVVAAAPSAFYLLLSLAAFSWLVRYR
ncbi:MAG TPA: LPS export ABC transporter permease LptG [Burkholderiaceae bacterium]|nr:LPS export ABC transporter permease LptG [Burkholderiaceae bacterium]